MSSFPKIWFLRHGETYWNAEKRIQGQLESELTPRGIEDAERQARLMPPILAQNPPCFVSNLGRAQQTARIALKGAQFETDNRLAEAHAGDWQGLLHMDVRRANPDVLSMDTTALDLFTRAPNGETAVQFQTRIEGFMAELTQPAVVVAHGLLGQVMRGLICGLAWDEMGHLPNEQGCVYVLENGTETILRETD
ncbi:MAG: histidine phosphatase family protein [Roseovarius sp.]